VLDELDAALDEANIGRFVDTVRGFLADSQFIVITHNRRTIGASDVLYGVTMQEQGISKVVSVKFSDYDQSGGQLRPAAAEPATQPAP
jgi:chromosome segregation protein